jgi:8-amino-7-oxononanoate synthase
LSADSTENWMAWIARENGRRRAAGLHRERVVHGGGKPGELERDGVTLAHFGSNDYLGLAADPRVIEAAAEAARRYGFGAGASPLVTGWREPHEALAAALAQFEEAEAVALFPSGYAANLGTIAALAGPGDVVYCDPLNHSCLVQGAKLSGAGLKVYPHRDAVALGRLLERHGKEGRYRRAILATDSVFSMDGDLAPLPELADLADEHGALLLVDEAHGTGVFGPDGRGACAGLGVADRVPVRVGTLSKALGSIGGFVAGSAALIEHIRHAAPTLMFSTALPPAAAAAAGKALEIAREEPWRRARAHALADRLRESLRGQGWIVPGSVGPIVPVLIGNPEATVWWAARLRECGFLTPAIRPPTVPAGTSRLRLSVTAAHTVEQVDRLAQAMGAWPMTRDG